MTPLVSTHLGNTSTTPRTAGLYDIYQAEERLGWRFDAWLISDLGDFGHLDQREANNIRRQFAQSRLALRTRALELGRAAAHVPYVLDQTKRVTPESKLQHLVSLHASFRRGSRDVQRKADRALVDGNYVEAGILQDLLDVHDTICELFEEAFRCKPLAVPAYVA